MAIEAAEGLTISNHIIDIPHAQYPHALTQAVRFTPTSSSSIGAASSSSSLFIWCGTIPASQAQAVLAAADTEEVDTTSAQDLELTAALAAAGRPADETSSSSAKKVPPGMLAQEFAVAMSTARTSTSSTGSAPPHSAPAVGTSLFNTPADIAGPMARRIATKLGIPQLFLSLDLPHPLSPVPGQPQRAEDSHALLCLERAIREVCASVLRS